MTKEEKAATCASRLTSFENLIAIFLRVERAEDLIKVDIIHCSHTLKDARRVGSDLSSGQVNTI